MVAGVAAPIGCRGQAEHHVRMAVFTEAARLDHSAAVVDDAEVDAYLDDLGMLVLEAARRLEGVDPGGGGGASLDVYDRFDVVLVHSVALNAWVYGDDFTCVTTNLVLQAEHPEEIVAVLCHEFGHLRETHIVEARERHLGHLAVGDTIGLVGTLGDLAAGFYGLPIPASSLAGAARKMHLQGFDPYRPADEFEADAYGVRLYASTGLDPALYDDFLERVIDLYGTRTGPSHPSPPERLRRVQTAVGRLDDDPTGRRLDAERLRATQDRLRTILVARIQSRGLVSHEEEVRALRRRGGRLPHATSCAPIMEDPQRLRNAFFEALVPEQP